MNLYLADRLEPGEEIVADVKVFSGPGLSWDLLPLAITVAGAYEALHNLTGPSSQAPPVLFSLASVLAAGWVLVAIRIRKSFYLAATGHRLVIVRATRRGVPAGVLASLQLESVALKTGHSLNRPAFVIAAASGPIPVGGKSHSRLRLIVVGRGKSGLEAFLDAVRAGGGAVDLPLTLGAIPAGPA
jgi:hypothetical protein